MLDKDVIYGDENDKDEYYTDENCHILELLNVDSFRDLSLAHARVEPGERTEWHKLRSTVEYYFILEGEGIVELGETFSQLMKKGSFVRIPSLMRQRITNTGKGDLKFLCICTPAFDESNYLRAE